MSRARIYNFEPEYLARLETDMWITYYDRQVIRLFRLSVQLLREQMGFDGWQALFNAYRLTRAAFVFKRGKGREDYRLALKWLRPFYRSLQRQVGAKWNPDIMADYELEWWIVHRHDFDPAQTASLEAALSDLCGALYNLPAIHLRDYSRYRAEAMLISDRNVNARARGEKTPPDWESVNRSLYSSYGSLSEELKRVRTGP